MEWDELELVLLVDKAGTSSETTELGVYSLSPRSSCAVAMEGLSPTAKAGAVVTSSRASKRRYVQRPRDSLQYR